MKKISLSKLESFLKEQCDALRGGGLDAAEYKDYIIAMIFLKRVNDQFAIAQQEHLKSLRQKYPDLTEEELQAEIEERNASVYEFYVPVRSRWNVPVLPKKYREANERDLADAEHHLAQNNLEEQERILFEEKKRTAEQNLQWRGLLPLTENVGDALTIALKQLEEHNSDVLGGVLSQTKFNVTNTKGEKILPDETLVQIIHDFNRYPLTDDSFEFPDLLGAAYEYLIKYFAESAGKKGGEFYTPSQVVELMAKILQPARDAEICDPTVGSGGLLISMKKYVEDRYGSARDLTLHGQELKDGTYRMCKMNMIFHGIRNANIQLGDTLLDPKLVTNGELRKYDIVVANPPFSQNYTTANMRFQERFSFWMSKKKHADFMFVQHMFRVLKNNGRMAVVMPHGVLFRSGKEKCLREYLITSGILECVIGLPPSLFYGTGIPASILIINKAGASTRDGVFFINADLEYQEGKNQNTLRPEDIEKISYVYTRKIEIPKYSRQVSRAELMAEDYNCNIRRYVDNAPEPENHDVQAHLTGGIPEIEVEGLDPFFACYPGVKDLLFAPLKPGYCQYTSAVSAKERIKDVLDQSPGVQQTTNDYMRYIDRFWTSVLPEMIALPQNQSVFRLSLSLSGQFASELATQQNPVLDEFQCRGAFAQYLNDLKSDLKSVAASAWNAELIPEEEILQSQFPEVLEDLRIKQARIEEIQAMFDEVAELEEGVWNPDDYQVIPKEQIKEIKAEIKLNKAAWKELEKEANALTKRIRAYQKVLDKKKSTEEEKEDAKQQIAVLEAEKKQKEAEMGPYVTAIEEAEAQIKTHVDLEAELKKNRADVRGIIRKKDELVDQAREKISPEEARELILARWRRTLESTICSYLDAHVRALQHNLESLFDKYNVTLNQILAERDAATAMLNSFLKDLGYEE